MSLCSQLRPLSDVNLSGNGREKLISIPASLAMFALRSFLDMALRDPPLAAYPVVVSNLFTSPGQVAARR